ncbi:MAG TPA: class I SAM-dependent methyltransferase [Candidatus Saccharimonadales bacterium]
MAEEQNPTIYEQAVTTDRTAETVAHKHGSESAAQFAESLPTNANVLDVGAGASPFGKEVAALRPDITWTNFDYSYYDEAILAEVKQGAPSNVAYAAGDATKLDDIYTEGTFDRVLSYWMLPHLSLDQPEPAGMAARAMFVVAKEGGILSAGPRGNKWWSPTLGSAMAISTVKDSTEMTAENYAAKIAAATRLAGLVRLAQQTSNEVATPFFGTTRYTKRQESGLPHVYNPESGKYVPALSREGLKVARDLVRATASYAGRRSREGLPNTFKFGSIAGVLAVGAAAAYDFNKRRKQ